MITDDPDTPGNGKWEINIGFTDEQDRASRTFELPQFDINYGLGDHIELTYEAGPLLVDDDGGSNRGQHAGLSDSLLGAKWRFLDEDSAGISMSTYPQLVVNSPPGYIRRGVAEQGTDLYLPLEIGRSFGKVDVAAEFGYDFIQHQSDQWQYGVVAGFAITEKLTLLGEVRVNSKENFGFNDVILNGGLTYALNDHVSILFSAGRSLRNAPQSSTLLAYLGIGLNF